MKARNRWLSMLLSLAMVGSTALPALAIQAQGLEGDTQTVPPVLFEEDFDDQTYHSGLTTYGNTQVEGGKLVLDGSANTYAELDGAMLEGKERLTISADLTTQMTNQLFFTIAIGQSMTNYAFLRFRQDEAAFHITDNGNWNEDKAGYTATESMLNVEKQVVMTFEPGKIALFIDGMPVAQASTDVTLEDLGGGDAQILLGKSFYNDPLFVGSYDNLTIYDGVLSAQMIAESNGLDWSQVEEELAAPVRELAEPELKYLTLTTDEHPTASELYYQQKIQNPVTDDIVLWDKSHSGYAISWESSHPELLSDQGELLQIPDADTYVTLTATVHVPGVDYLSDQSAAQKELTVLVPCPETRRQLDFNALVITNPDDVRDMLPLVAQGENGSHIDWISSDPNVITDAPASDSDLYGGGVVTRPAAGEGPKTVTLTAVVTMDGVDGALTKTWDVTVTPQTAQDSETDKYLFVYYGENYDWDQDGITQEEIYFGVSEDGFTWNNLNVKTREDGSVYTQPMLQSTVGDLGVRDAHIVRSPNGDKFYIIATDLRAVGTGPANKEESGWDGRMDTQNGSQSLVIWESNDLVNWSEPRLVKVNFDSAGHTWAPEATWDPDANAYLVYWSSRDNAQDDFIRVYCSYTRDFQTFSEPQVFVDTSDNVDTGWTGPYSSIDTTIAKDGDTYYRITKNNGTHTCYYETSISLQGPWTWGGVIQGTGTAEGPTHYQLADGRWVLLVDNYWTYVPFVGDSLADLSQVVGTEGGFQQADISFPGNGANYKHGTVLAISDEEYDRLLEAYGVETSQPPAVNEDGMFYSENFESDTTPYLTLHGDAAVTSCEEGNALYLDGNAANYAELPVGWMDGMDTFTVSMDVKPENQGGFNMTFAVGTDLKRRFFTRVCGDNIETQISSNDNAGAHTVRYNPNPYITDQWVKLTLVLDATNETLTVYVDGVKVGEKTGVTTTISQLGMGIRTYFGKSFYADPGYKGWMDNIQMWNRALTAEEVANLGDAQAITYTVTFDTNGGTQVEAQTVTSGTAPLEPEQPTKDGYVFDGWYTDENLTQAYQFDAVVMGNVTLYAKWTDDHSQTKLEGQMEATCTEDGYTGDLVCTICGEIVEAGQVIPATGHHYEDGVCTNCGAQDPDYEEPAGVNKTLLQKTYDYALTLDTTGVVDAAVEQLEQAMKAAQAVLDNDQATQDEVNTAWDHLLEAIWSLGLKQGDKAMLNLLVERANAMMGESEKYVETNWQQLLDALTAAQNVASDGNAMQEDVDEAAEALLDAILAQRYKADKSILEDLLTQAENVELSGASPEAVAVFCSALANAKAVMANDDLSADDQKIVDNAVAALSSAIDGLTAGGAPEMTDTPEHTNQPEGSDKPQTTPAPEQNEVPATGDQSELLMSAAVLVCAVASMGWLTVCHRREKR